MTTMLRLLMVCVLVSFLLLSAYAQTGEDIGNSGDSEGLASMLLEATNAGDFYGIEQALQSGEDINSVNENGWTAASFSVGLSNLETLKFLIDKGIDLNIANNEGYTPLMLAALQSDKEMVELLLLSNADPTITAANGDNAYTIAKNSRRLINAAIILEACVIRGMVMDDPDLVLRSVHDGAYVNIRSSGGWNPLIYASAYGYDNLVGELLQLGANVHHVENEMWSPLHFAAANGHDEIIRKLVAAGADLYAVTQGGQTAVALAEAEGHPSSAALINELLQERQRDL